MKKKINIDRERISSSDIEARKNFGSLVKKYPSIGNPFRKTSWRTKGILWVIVASVALVYYITSREDAAASFIQPPLPGVNIPYSHYKVDASKGGDFTYHTGTRIIIPENSFLDQQGSLVQGEVELKYREFHDPAEFFISGIPMEYDSVGTKYQFESAGMLEINAFQNGEVLKMNPEQPIRIEMASNSNETKFNLYYLDTLDRNWVFKGKDRIIQEDTLKIKAPTEATDSTAADTSSIPVTRALKNIQKDISKMEAGRPFLPKKADEAKYNFNLEVDAREFPELAVYHGIRFEVGDENKGFTSGIFKTIWEEATVSEHKRGVSYTLTLKKGQQKYTFIVYPALKGVAYEKAAAEFDSRYKQYQKTLEAKKAEEKRLLEEYELARNKAEQERKKMVEEIRLQTLKWEQEMKANAAKWEQQAKAMAREVETENNFTRFFTIDRFGIWNSDCPSSLPKGALLVAKFMSGEGNEIIGKNIFMVEKGVNILYRYNSTDYNRFSYNPQSQNVLWAVYDGKLNVFTPEDFARVGKKEGEYTFNLKAIDKTISNSAELKSVLGI